MRSSVVLLVGALLLPTALPQAEQRHAELAKAAAYKNPLDVTVDEKGEIAWVLLSGARSLAQVDLKAGKVKNELPWPPNLPMPGPSSVSRHHRPAGFGGLRPRMTNGAQEAYVANPPGANVRGVWFDVMGELIAHQLPKSGIPATQVAQGWVFTNALSLVLGQRPRRGGFPAIDGLWGNPQLLLDTRETIPLDEPNRGYADPADVVVSPNDRFWFVACAGADTVLVIDVKSLRTYLGPTVEELGLYLNYRSGDDLTASRHYVIAKLPTQANPRRLGLSGNGKTLVVSNYLADSLTVIDAENLKVVKHIPLGGPEPDATRRGEILFNSAKLTFQGQFSCASCHPNGGADGLNWDLTRDGVGNFKNTKSLLGIKDTAPYGWLGTSPTLEDRIKGTLRTLHRYEPTDEELGDLAAYLKTLQPPEPPAVNEEDKPALARGKALFEGKGRCATCHSGPAFDDGKSHDVGTGSFPGEDRFNTPSLRGIGRTAPYLHDGSAETLKDIFEKRNPKQRHGEADKLTPEEMADLIAYLRSL